MSVSVEEKDTFSKDNSNVGKVIPVELDMSSVEARTKAISRLTNQYGDPLSAMIRELNSNALDSYSSLDESSEKISYIDVFCYVENELKDSGSWNSSSFIKDKEKEWLLEDGSHYLIVSDFGVGMTHTELLENYVQYNSSTKTNDDSTIGAYGLGGKTPLAYTDSFIVDSVKDGVRTTVRLFFEEDKGYQAEVIHYGDTTESNGTSVIVKLLNDLDYKSALSVADGYLKRNIKQNISVNGNRGEVNYYNVGELSDDDGTVLGRIWMKKPLKKDNDSKDFSFFDFSSDRFRSPFSVFEIFVGGWGYSISNISNIDSDFDAYHTRSKRASTNHILFETEGNILEFNSSRDEILSNEMSKELVSCFSLVKENLKNFFSIYSEKAYKEYGDEILPRIAKSFTEINLMASIYNGKSILNYSYDAQVEKVDNLAEKNSFFTFDRLRNNSYTSKIENFLYSLEYTRDTPKNITGNYGTSPDKNNLPGVFAFISVSSNRAGKWTSSFYESFRQEYYGRRHNYYHDTVVKLDANKRKPEENYYYVYSVMNSMIEGYLEPRTSKRFILIKNIPEDSLKAALNKNRNNYLENNSFTKNSKPNFVFLKEGQESIFDCALIDQIKTLFPHYIREIEYSDYVEEVKPKKKKAEKVEKDISENIIETWRHDPKNLYAANSCAEKLKDLHNKDIFVIGDSDKSIKRSTSLNSIYNVVRDYENKTSKLVNNPIFINYLKKEEVEYLEDHEANLIYDNKVGTRSKFLEDKHKESPYGKDNIEINYARLDSMKLDFFTTVILESSSGAISNKQGNLDSRMMNYIGPLFEKLMGDDSIRFKKVKELSNTNYNSTEKMIEIQRSKLNFLYKGEEAYNNLYSLYKKDKISLSREDCLVLDTAYFLSTCDLFKYRYHLEYVYKLLAPSFDPYTRGILYSNYLTPDEVVEKVYNKMSDFDRNAVLDTMNNVIKNMDESGITFEKKFTDRFDLLDSLAGKEE